MLVGVAALTCAALASEPLDRAWVAQRNAFLNTGDVDHHLSYFAEDVRVFAWPVELGRRQVLQGKTAIARIYELPNIKASLKSVGFSVKGVAIWGQYSAIMWTAQQPLPGFDSPRGFDIAFHGEGRSITSNNLIYASTREQAGFFEAHGLGEDADILLKTIEDAFTDAPILERFPTSQSRGVLQDWASISATWRACSDQGAEITATFGQGGRELIIMEHPGTCALGLMLTFNAQGRIVRADLFVG